MSPINDLQNLYTNMDAALKRCNDKLAEKRVDPASTLYEVGDKISTLKADYGDFIDGTITEAKIKEPEYIYTVRPYAFYDCKNLVTATGIWSARSIGDYAFCNCESLTTIDTFGESFVETIGNYAFYGCSGLDTIWFGNDVRNIGSHSFASCSNLRKIAISTFDGYVSIGDYAFKDCVNLTKIRFGRLDYNTSFGTEVFKNCNNINTLIFDGFDGDGIFDFDIMNELQNTPIAQGTGYIYVRSSMIASYQSNVNWSQYASQFRAIEDYPNIWVD